MGREEELAKAREKVKREVETVAKEAAQRAETRGSSEGMIVPVKETNIVGEHEPIKTQQTLGYRLGRYLEHKGHERAHRLKEEREFKAESKRKLADLKAQLKRERRQREREERLQVKFLRQQAKYGKASTRQRVYFKRQIAREKIRTRLLSELRLLTRGSDEYMEVLRRLRA